MQQTDNLQQLIINANWIALYERFNRMTNAEFRRTEQIVREKVLPALSNSDYWNAFLHLLLYRRQAFLSSILAIHHLARTNQLDFSTAEPQAFIDWIHTNSSESVIKLLRMGIPQLTTSQQIVSMIRWTDSPDSREVAAILTKETSAHAYHALFQFLKHEDDDMPLLRTSCTTLLRKGDDMSFNMASILRSYFDIKDINSTLSLHIEPYELSYIDQSFDNFMHVLKGRRPKLI